MLFNKLKNLFKSREKIEKAIPKIKLKKDNIRNCEIVLDREELLSKIPKNSIIAEIGVDEGEFSSKILNKDSITPIILGKNTLLARDISSDIASTKYMLVGKTDLLEAIYILSSATVVISNDSGLMHVASATNTKKMISLFGSSSPKYTPPLANIEKSTIIYKSYFSNCSNPRRKRIYNKSRR